MKRVWVNGRAVELLPAQVLGKGGEADIYAIGNGQALKLFKAPDHPDWLSDAERAQARARLAEHQEKLRAFPSNLPQRVVVPTVLVTDRKGDTILGYVMRQVEQAGVLHLFADRTFGAGVRDADVVAILCDLYDSVAAVHQRQVVIGDFNDLNVLVCKTQAHLIDADSYQFNGFLCTMFTQRFVDPLGCREAGGELELYKEHNENSDWYAFAVILMQSLLYVDPYGGSYWPKSKQRRMPQHLRPLERITVFHPEVRYPKPARPYQILPDALLQELSEIFINDRRGPLPRALIEQLSFDSCDQCGLVHARSSCPSCKAQQPAAAITRVGVKDAQRVARTRGRFVVARWQAGRLLWLAREEESLRRESGEVVLTGTVRPRMGFALCGKQTLVGNGGKLAVLQSSTAPGVESADEVDGETIFAANSRHRYWPHGGTLWRDGEYGPVAIGEVLANQTRIWVGESFGFGFYRAANLCVGLVFDAERRGLLDQVKMPAIAGQLLSARCVFAEDRAWLVVTTQHRGVRAHSCSVIRRDGVVEASTKSRAEEGIGEWGGICASGKKLFVATDDALVTFEVASGKIVERHRTIDLDGIVDSTSQLVLSDGALAVVNEMEVYLLNLE